VCGENHGFPRGYGNPTRVRVRSAFNGPAPCTVTIILPWECTGGPAPYDLS